MEPSRVGVDCACVVYVVWFECKRSYVLCVYVVLARLVGTSARARASFDGGIRNDGILIVCSASCFPPDIRFVRELLRRCCAPSTRVYIHTACSLAAARLFVASIYASTRVCLVSGRVCVCVLVLLTKASFKSFSACCAGCVASDVAAGVWVWCAGLRRRESSRIIRTCTRTVYVTSRCARVSGDRTFAVWANHV